MKKKELKEYTQAEIRLYIRSCFGRWRLPNGEAYILGANPVKEENSLRQFTSKHIRGYRPAIVSNLDHNQAIILIDLLIQDKAVHEYVAHPELAQFFRNGKPVTSGTIFTDFIENYKPSAPQEVEKTDFDFSDLLDAFN